MLCTTIAAVVLVAVTVAIHSAGLVLVLHSRLNVRAETAIRFWPVVWLLIRVTWMLILIHMAEIAIWALFYLWRGCLPDAESAIYFSGVTYATIGYGELVLSKPWRVLAPVEGLTGILMCGLSAGLFFALITRINSWRSEVRAGGADEKTTPSVKSISHSQGEL